METEEVRRSQTAAERTRFATQSARENSRLEVEAELRKLEEDITSTVRTQREDIAKIVAEAANTGRDYASHIYSERISASRSSREEVAFIEDCADIVTERLVADLQADGYDTTAQSREVVDPRDYPNSPPEYYETTFIIKW